jgi:hypothetical protein
MTDHERIARFVSEVGRAFYAPTSHQQEATMAKDFDNTNRGALFKNDEKAATTAARSTSRGVSFGSADGSRPARKARSF